jgi:acyl-CoA thioesterase FadM
MRRSVAFSKGLKGYNFFLDSLRITGVIVFVVGQLFTFTQEAHYLCKRSQFGHLKFLLHWSHAGKTSYTTNVDWFDTNNQKIGSFLTKHIAADAETRRPVALSDDFFQNIQAHFATIHPRTIEKVPLPIIPDKAYSLNVRALYSDCDDNNHVNQATYLKWCSDAASAGAIAGHFSIFKKHIELYPLKSMELYYSGEGYLNDELVVNVWECPHVNSSLAFAIVKERSIIFHMNMSFYSNQSVDISSKI